jgi:hypothetical protein
MKTFRRIATSFVKTQGRATRRTTKASGRHDLACDLADEILQVFAEPASTITIVTGIRTN